MITAAVWRRGDQKRLSSKGESFGNRSVPQRRVRFAWECSGDAIALLVERFPRWLRHQHRITVDEGAQGDLRGTLAAKGTW